MMFRPVNRIEYSEPWPGKLPAIGVKPWMNLSRHSRDECVSRYWMYSGPFE